MTKELSPVELAEVQRFGLDKPEHTPLTLAPFRGEYHSLEWKRGWNAAVKELPTRLLDLEDRVAKVLAVHVEGTEDTLPWDCYNGECSHEGECPPVPVQVCERCTADAFGLNEEASVVGWPCPLVATLTLGGN